ncbi:FRG domain-containing protein [Pedobacter aquatilis]|uniref:FRG domain-containing protein n=1 Tax=Pedobacter aquatilis TaxID=351343 RepID=UPI00293104B4|nr:FRG domain-containing protein [Pedobacter aquatilis]
MQEIEDAKTALGYDGQTEIFYRGHSNCDYKLSPGLLRNEKNAELSQKTWEAEQDMFYEFQSRARDLHVQKLNDWDVLFYMQHHGVKTRLLDWTEIFGVALFFALDTYTIKCPGAKYEPCIWMTNPYKLNEEFDHGEDLWSPENLDCYNLKNQSSYSEILLQISNVDPFEWDLPVALYPQRRGDRLSNQGGYFTIHGNDTRPLEQLASDKLLKKINIPKEAIPMAHRFLEQAGINYYTLFPGLDGLAVYLNKKYSL